MEARPLFEKVTKGLDTTADKIRALVDAGYLRTEIAKLLGVRYQHVRNVLKRSGIEGGLRATVAIELDPLELEVFDEPPKPTFGNVLLEGGFVYLGDWKPANADGIELTVKAPDEPGVYAFVVDDAIKYVGITQRTFHQRMYGYKRGYARHRTSARVKKLIRAMLDDGQVVKIMVATPKEGRTWNGLPVDTAAGLIRLIKPEWNMLGVKPLPEA